MLFTNGLCAGLPKTGSRRILFFIYSPKLAAAAVAAVISAAAEQDDKDENDPGAAIVSVGTVTHSILSPFPDTSTAQARGVSSISYYVDV